MSIHCWIKKEKVSGVYYSTSNIQFEESECDDTLDVRVITGYNNQWENFSTSTHCQ